MHKFKGVTYQRKANEGTSTQNAPKVTIPNDANKSTDLSFDLGNWLVNTKVPVPVLELCKIPGHKEKLFENLRFPNQFEFFNTFRASLKSSKAFHP